MGRESLVELGVGSPRKRGMGAQGISGRLVGRVERDEEKDVELTYVGFEVLKERLSQRVCGNIGPRIPKRGVNA